MVEKAEAGSSGVQQTAAWRMPIRDRMLEIGELLDISSRLLPNHSFLLGGALAGEYPHLFLRKRCIDPAFNATELDRCHVVHCQRNAPPLMEKDVFVADDRAVDVCLVRRSVF